jgi:hypothetical protein
VSPILMRPVREQLEHDRVIRLLHARYRRRHQVGINVGNEQTASVGNSTSAAYPDLVLWSNERGRRVEAVVEVETSESVNNMEALAEWLPFGRMRAPFYLYIPNGSVDSARRLIADNNIPVAEIWTYYLIGDQMRFAMVYKAPAPSPRAVARQPRPRATGSRTATQRRKTAARRPAAKTARKRQRPAKKTARTTRTQKRK